MAQDSHGDARKIVASVQQIVAQRMGGQGAGHGMDHVLRVHRLACAIQAVEGGDRLVVELAAILHDIGDAKFHDGRERSGEFSREILTEQELPPAMIDEVADIVDRISFRKGIDPNTLSLAGKVVQDADRIEALGAVGLVRMIEYGAIKGQPFYVPGDPLATPSGIGHMHEKLFKLPDLLNTDTARRIAAGRISFMRDFLDQFVAEIEVSMP